MGKWYVIKIRSIITPEGLIQYKKSTYAGPFDHIHAAREIAYYENAFHRERGYNEEFSIGMEEDIHITGTIGNKNTRIGSID